MSAHPAATEGDWWRQAVVYQIISKNLAEPLEPLGLRGALASSPHGTHPLRDRDEVHGIYAEWRQVFNEYDPPRVGVAEAWVHPSRRPRYASPALTEGTRCCD